MKIVVHSEFVKEHCPRYILPFLPCAPSSPINQTCTTHPSPPPPQYLPSISLYFFYQHYTIPQECTPDISITDMKRIDSTVASMVVRDPCNSLKNVFILPNLIICISHVTLLSDCSLTKAMCTGDLHASLRNSTNNFQR